MKLKKGELRVYHWGHSIGPELRKGLMVLLAKHGYEYDGLGCFNLKTCVGRFDFNKLPGYEELQVAARSA